MLLLVFGCEHDFLNDWFVCIMYEQQKSSGVSIEKYGSTEVHGQFVMRLCGQLTWMIKHALVEKLTVDMAGSAVESGETTHQKIFPFGNWKVNYYLRGTKCWGIRTRGGAGPKFELIPWMGRIFSSNFYKWLMRVGASFKLV